MSRQATDNDVPPEKTGLASPWSSSLAMTPIARTTCHSFSIRPGSVARALATSSTMRGSSTLEAQSESVVANLAADTPANSDDTSRRYLCRAPRVVVLHRTARQCFDAHALQCFPQRRETLRRYEGVVEGRFDGARVKAIPNFQKLAFLHELPQGTADLVVAADIVEIGAQKHIAALAVDPLQ